MVKRRMGFREGLLKKADMQPHASMAASTVEEEKEAFDLVLDCSILPVGADEK